MKFLVNNIAIVMKGEGKCKGVWVGMLWAFFCAQATHFQGADIWYEYLGGNDYKIYLYLYRDCAGISLSTTQTLYVASSCSSFSVTLNYDGMEEVSPLCPAQIGNSTCNGGTLPGTERYRFSAVVTLNCTAPDWVFYWSGNA